MEDQNEEKRARSNLYEEDSVTAAGALVEFSGGCGAVETGRDEMSVKVGKGREGCVRQPGNQDVSVLVFTDGQVLGTWG